MTRTWTFGRKIAAGFAAMVALAIVVDAVSILTLHNVVASKNKVINVNAHRLIDAEDLSSQVSGRGSTARSYIILGDTKDLATLKTSNQTFTTTIASVLRGVDAANRPLVERIASDEGAYEQAIETVLAQRTPTSSIPDLGRVYAAQVTPHRTKLGDDITAFVANENKILDRARQASNDAASNAVTLIEILALVSVILAAGLAFVLARVLRRQIGTAVGEVNSSSSELQATANQQASGAKEQATAMSEVTTTINELLATSRQIAESAQRVAQIADRAADAGRSGIDTIGKAQTSIVDIRRQVDVIVDHMLALGEKSQQIGAVLDIVTELAEQTNILAINSTIEAAGAGDAGKRFAVVADEIRKLADRVADSTKEIRALIDVVRGAVNTTVMATEIGSKAVDAGNEQFADVTEMFGEITSLVATTTEAAREIELSTKQQATAVEQVNVAISNVAQSTKEAEASSTQTFQTASQLTNLSRDLARLVEPQAVS